MQNFVPDTWTNIQSGAIILKTASILLTSLYFLKWRNQFLKWKFQIFWKLKKKKRFL